MAAGGQTRNNFLVTEKLDGSCMALGSQGFVASRRKIMATFDLSNEAEMKEVLGSTKFASLPLTSLAKHLKTDLPGMFTNSMIFCESFTIRNIIFL